MHAVCTWKMLDFAYDKTWTRLEWQNVGWSGKTCVMRQELTFFTHPKFCNERYYAYKSIVSRLNAVSFKCYEWAIQYPLSYPLKFFLKNNLVTNFQSLLKLWIRSDGDCKGSSWQIFDRTRWKSFRESLGSEGDGNCWQTDSTTIKEFWIKPPL